jgi:excalibur calcium-binding domain-containing protein
MRFAVVVVLAALVTASSVAAAAPAIDYKTYRNCDALNAVDKHGVGRVGARDHTRSGTNSVTNFTRNNRLYELNKARDRDKDKIACEQH